MDNGSESSAQPRHGKQESSESEIGKTACHDLDTLFGSWSEEEADQFDEAD